MKSFTWSHCAEFSESKRYFFLPSIFPATRAPCSFMLPWICRSLAFSVLLPSWCFLCHICLVLTLYHHVHLFIPPPFSISPGSLHFIDMTNTSTQSSPALNITMLFLSHHSYTLHWSHLIQNCLNKLCIKVILLNIHHVIISVARGGFTYLSYYSHWSPITNTLCYAITFSPLMTFRAQFLNYYGWHLLHSRNLEVYFTFASSSPFNHKLHIWSKFSDRTRWPKTYTAICPYQESLCTHTHIIDASNIIVMHQLVLLLAHLSPRVRMLFSQQVLKTYDIQIINFQTM